MTDLSVSRSCLAPSQHKSSNIQRRVRRTLYPRKFEYFAPGSVKEALKLLHEKEDAKVLAGGQSLLALMKLRLASPATLVDITQVKDDLAFVRKEKAHLAIGALTPHDYLEHDKTVGSRFPIIVDAVSKIGDQQI